MTNKVPPPKPPGDARPAAPGPVEVPNAMQVQALREERASLLEKRRMYELRRIDAERGERDCTDRLRLVEACLDGVALGRGLAEELARHTTAAAGG